MAIIGGIPHFQTYLDQGFLQCFFETVANRLISQPYSLSLTASQCNFILQSAPAMLLVCTLDNSWQHCARMKRNNGKDDKEPKLRLAMWKSPCTKSRICKSLVISASRAPDALPTGGKQLITYDNIIWLVVSTPLNNMKVNLSRIIMIIPY